MTFSPLDELEIMLLSPSRLREMVLYERLLSSHILPSEKISEPIILYPGLLNEKLAEVAINMFTNKRQCPSKITDRRITFNGFSIGLYNVSEHEESGMSFTLKLESKCPVIKFIGVDEIVPQNILP